MVARKQREKKKGMVPKVTSFPPARPYLLKVLPPHDITKGQWPGGPLWNIQDPNCNST
jgi:hypothetical protein